MMTQDQLQQVMIFHLGNFNTKGVAIDENTIHNTVLSAGDGFGTANSKNIYRAAIRWTLQTNGMPDKPWPSDWFTNSVTYLATNII